jgi:hypothetical protein
MKIKLFLSSILYLFGTFLHEFGHFAAALLLGRPEGFSVMPKIKDDMFVFGEVRARVRYKVLSVFIAAAPLIWWAFLFLMLRHLLYASILAVMQEFNIPIFFKKLKSFSLRDAFTLWLAFQLLWAGRLSKQDIKTCFSGLISPSGLVLISSAALLVQLIRHIR